MLPGVTPVHKGLAPSRLSFTKLNIIKELLLNLSFKAQTNCKLHCGVRAVRCLRSFPDRHLLPDTDALRIPQQQQTIYRLAAIPMIQKLK